jgi:uncharacterized protein (DUF2062 family)
MVRQARRISPVVVAPTHNNARTLADVVMRITRLGLPVIVVNDGSTDATAEVLRAIETSSGGAVRVACHEENRGKGAALRTGFATAAETGFTHAITIDTDGQLDPEEIPAMLRAAEASPTALIVGTRDETKADYPARSLIGRRVSNLLVRLESGVRISDSQCGFRVYPLALTRAARCGAGFFGFETEIITRAAWAGWDVKEVVVTCRYLPIGERVSHFRPWLDSLRAVGMHARLLTRAMLPVPHHRSVAQQQFASLPTPASSDARPLCKRMIQWLSPARAWRELREENAGTQETAAALAVGAFIGNLPLYGLHTALSLYAARRLHLHPLAVVAGSHVSTPPVGPLLVVAAVGVGHYLLHGSWLAVTQLPNSAGAWMELAGKLLIEWSIGGTIIGAAIAGAVFGVATFLLRFLRME